MADEANNQSVIVYDLATQTVSIKKIGDLGKFNISTPPFLSYWANVRRNEPSTDPTNPQIQEPCENHHR